MGKRTYAKKSDREFSISYKRNRFKKPFISQTV